MNGSFVELQCIYKKIKTYIKYNICVYKAYFMLLFESKNDIIKKNKKVKIMEYKKQNFSRHEFACKCGCGFSAMDAELLEVLEDVRAHFNSPIRINSGCRCQEHNREIGGAKTSMHTKGMACDFVVTSLDNQDPVADYLENKYPNKHGIGRYVGRTHVDVREGKARWDKR